MGRSKRDERPWAERRKDERRTPLPPRHVVARLIEDVVLRLGGEILRYDAARPDAVRIVVDRASGDVGTDFLIGVIKAIRAEMEYAGIDPGDFHLEVDSPGERRLLTTPAHFARFAGSEVRVELARPEGDDAVLRGRLLGADGARARIALEGGGERTIDPKDARAIRLVRLSEGPGASPSSAPSGS